MFYSPVIQPPFCFMIHWVVLIQWIIHALSKTPKNTYSIAFDTSFFSQVAFRQLIFCQLISLFSLFLLLFMGLTTLFGIIHESLCTILVNFYLYLQYFSKKFLISAKYANPKQTLGLSSQPSNFFFQTIMKWFLTLSILE